MGVKALYCLIFILLASKSYEDVIDDPNNIFRFFQSRYRDLEPQSSEQISNPTSTAAGEVSASGIPVAVSEESEDDDEDDADYKLGNKAVDILTSIFGSGLQQGPGIFSVLRQYASEPWWQKENVCITRNQWNETIANSSSTQISPFFFLGNAAFSTCRKSVNKYVCTSTVRSMDKSVTTEMSYKCCPGSRHDFEKDACEKVDVKSLTETVSSLGAKKFSNLLEKSAKQSVVNGANMTIFSPSDKAIDLYVKYFETEQPKREGYTPVVRDLSTSPDKSGLDSSENEIPNGDAEKQTISLDKAFSGDKTLSHIVAGHHDIYDLVNEQVLMTVDGLPVRINVYHSENQPKFTANCALIKVANYPTSNDSLIDVTDAVIPSVKKSIKQILEETSDFQMFKDLLDKSKLLDMFDGSEKGNYTLFVPSNAAMAKNPELVGHLSKGQSCVNTILRSHMMSRTVCDAAIGRGRVISRNMAGNWMMMERKDAQKIVVGLDSETEVVNIVATNGVIHVVSNLIVPPAAEPVSKLLQEGNHTTWLKLIEKAGLKEELDNSGQNHTLFVPSEEALLGSELAKENADIEEIRRVVRFHISDDSVCTCQMAENLMVPSKLPESSVRINLYGGVALLAGLEPTITAQCAIVKHSDQKACDSVVHEVDRVLTPTTKSILEIIQSDPEYETLRNIISGTILEQELKNGSMGPVTLLAPSNEAFATLTKEEIEKLNDKSTANDLIARHVVQGVWCCNGVQNTNWPFYNEVVTASGTVLNVRRNQSKSSQVVFGNTVTSKCDVLATDGILHTVDKVMMPRPVSLKGSSVKFINKNGTEVLLVGL